MPLGPKSDDNWVKCFDLSLETDPELYDPATRSDLIRSFHFLYFSFTLYSIVKYCIVLSCHIVVFFCIVLCFLPMWRINVFIKHSEILQCILLPHHEKCWSLIGWARVTWPALLYKYRLPTANGEILHRGVLPDAENYSRNYFEVFKSTRMPLAPNTQYGGANNTVAKSLSWCKWVYVCVCMGGYLGVSLNPRWRG